MYERSYGYKYDELTKYESTSETAKRIRADIRQAVNEGLLPGAPVKYSVRSDVNSIDVMVKGWIGWGEDPNYEPAKMTLQRIHGAYNHDGSDIQSDYFDVNYYGSVVFETPEHAAFMAGEKARLAQRKAEREAALTDPSKVKRVKVLGRERSTVHLAAEVDGKIRLACGATLWRSSIASLTDDEPTCSRCAKKAR